MIRVTDLWYFEIRYIDSVLVENKIKLLARCATWIRRLAVHIGASQSRGAHEQINFVFAPKRIEIPGNHHGLLSLLDQVIKFAKLQMPVSILERQVNQEHGESHPFQAR